MERKFKKTEVKLWLLTDIDIVEKGIEGQLCNTIHRFGKANNKYMNNLIKIKNLHILSTGIWIINMLDNIDK